MMYPQVNAVIAVLNSIDTEFNMAYPSKCIGGHCRKSLKPERFMEIEEAFRRVSGIDDTIIADMVCFPRRNHHYLATVPQVIEMLEYLRDYGIVDWDKVMGEVHA